VSGRPVRALPDVDLAGFSDGARGSASSGFLQSASGDVKKTMELDTSG